MNLFHEVWPDEITDRASEAVVHTTGRRKTGAADRCDALLRQAFAEAFRILKPGRSISVVFGNSNGRIWDWCSGRFAMLESRLLPRTSRFSTRDDAGKRPDFRDGKRRYG
jgi:hypothetical protein